MSDQHNPFGTPNPGHAAQPYAPESAPNYGVVPQGAPMQAYGAPPSPQAYGYPGQPNMQPYGQPQGYGPPAYAPAPINIVVQNTANAVAHGGGLVRVSNRSRTLAALLAIFLGGIGVHKFYLGQTFVGLLYLVFSFTFIPAVIAFFEGVGLLMTSDHSFDMKYNARLA